MKKWISLFTAAVIVLGVNACVSTNDIDIKNVNNNKVNMQGYKTYQVLEDSGVVESDSKCNVKQSDKKIAAMIEEIINTELQKRGKLPIAKNPDFYVAYVAGSDTEAVCSKLDKKGKETLEKAPQAALLILLIDADTGRILKLSTAEGEMKNLPNNEQHERIEYAVKKMLRDI